MPYLSVPDGRAVSTGVKGKKLTPLLLEIIDLYMIHMNMTKAVELSRSKTRSPGRHAAQIMQHPLVREEIAKRLEKRSDKSELTAEYLIQKLLNIIEADETKIPDTLRAIELAGKSIALWKERQEISGPDGAAIQQEINTKESVADFTRRISGLAKRNGTDNVVPLRGLPETEES